MLPDKTVTSIPKSGKNVIVFGQIPATYRQPYADEVLSPGAHPYEDYQTRWCSCRQLLAHRCGHTAALRRNSSDTQCIHLDE